MLNTLDIIQIIPAPPGLVVDYTTNENDEEIHTAPVVCLALVKAPEGRRIVPVTQWSFVEGHGGYIEEGDLMSYGRVHFSEE